MFTFIYFGMGFSYLVDTEASVATFKVQFNFPLYVDIVYCYKENIEEKRMPKVIFIPFMAIPEGGVRFPLDPILLRTLSFYSICPNQGLPNFYRVVSCAS